MTEAISLFESNSAEYQTLEKAAKEISEKTGRKCCVDDTYFDYGQCWKWTTILMKDENNTFSFQLLNPKQQSDIIYGLPEEYETAISEIVAKHKYKVAVHEIAERHGTVKKHEADKKYVVVCYAIHERKIASYDPFESEEAANEFLEKDAKDTYTEEVNNVSEEEKESIDLEIYGDGTATLSSHDNEYIWTWEIIEIRS